MGENNKACQAIKAQGGVWAASKDARVQGWTKRLRSGKFIFLAKNAPRSLEVLEVMDTGNVRVFPRFDTPMQALMAAQAGGYRNRVATTTPGLGQRPPTKKEAQALKEYRHKLKKVKAQLKKARRSVDPGALPDYLEEPRQFELSCQGTLPEPCEHVNSDHDPEDQVDKYNPYEERYGSAALTMYYTTDERS